MKTTNQRELGDDYIWTIWRWCSEVYVLNNVSLNFPKNTDPKKTYQWRYLTNLARKFLEWDFDEDTAKQFIKVAIDYAKSVRKLNKGLTIFQQKNIIDICYNKLKNNSDSNSSNIVQLESIHNWFSTIDGDKTAVLLKRQNRGLRNITIWYNANKLTILFMALSKTCTRTINRIEKIDKMERGMLPSKINLYMLNKKFLSENYNQAYAILKDDLHKWL